MHPGCKVGSNRQRHAFGVGNSILAFTELPFTDTFTYALTNALAVRGANRITHADALRVANELRCSTNSK